MLFGILSDKTIINSGRNKASALSFVISIRSSSNLSFMKTGTTMNKSFVDIFSKLFQRLNRLLSEIFKIIYHQLLFFLFFFFFDHIRVIFKMFLQNRLKIFS